MEMRGRYVPDPAGKNSLALSWRAANAINDRPPDLDGRASLRR